VAHARSAVSAPIHPLNKPLRNLLPIPQASPRWRRQRLWSSCQRVLPCSLLRQSAQARLPRKQACPRSLTMRCHCSLCRK
jgi:hypothetical protein